MDAPCGRHMQLGTRTTDGKTNAFMLALMGLQILPQSDFLSIVCRLQSDSKLNRYALNNGYSMDTSTFTVPAIRVTNFDPSPVAINVMFSLILPILTEANLHKRVVLLQRGLCSPFT